MQDQNLLLQLLSHSSQHSLSPSSWDGMRRARGTSQHTCLNEADCSPSPMGIQVLLPHSTCVSSFDFLFFASFHLENTASRNEPSGVGVGMRSSSNIYPQGFIYFIIFLVVGHPSAVTINKFKTCPVILLAICYLGVANLGGIRQKKIFKLS